MAEEKATLGADQAQATNAGAEQASPPTATSSARRRDAYEVLGVPKDATGTQIKCAYQKLGLQLRSDKNADDPEAAERFKEVSYAYGILINPEKRKQYDTSGFEGVDLEGLDMDLDLTHLGTFSTMFFAFFSKLGVPFKTSISADVLEQALKGTMTVTPLALGRPIQAKVEKQHAHFYELTITQSQADAGIVVRVTSTAQSKFKLLYFSKEEDGGLLQLVSQEDSVKAGKLTAAGMYFLNFQVYRLDVAANALAMAKNPDAAFFKRLEGLTPCEVSRLQEGTHIFAVYGDNYFKNASYSIEAVCGKEFEENARSLQKVETQLVGKKAELVEFETEYQEALARFNAVTARYAEEKQAVKDLLKQWDKIHGSFSTTSAEVEADKAVEADSSKAEGQAKGLWSKNWFGLKPERK